MIDHGKPLQQSELRFVLTSRSRNARTQSEILRWVGNITGIRAIPEYVVIPAYPQNTTLSLLPFPSAFYLQPAPPPPALLATITTEKLYFDSFPLRTENATPIGTGRSDKCLCNNGRYIIGREQLSESLRCLIDPVVTDFRPGQSLPAEHWQYSRIHYRQLLPLSDFQIQDYTILEFQV